MEKYLDKLREIININLEKKIRENSVNNEFTDMMIYASLLGGKRIRPIIMYILADVYNKSYEYIEDEAVALELIHSYSLVHDDLPAMDDDTYRRGNLTLHKKFGEANAILVGDALLTFSFYILANSKYSNKNTIAYLAYYSGHKAMILGQYLDMLSENIDIDYNDLLEIQINKTAMLLMASVDIAASNLKIDLETRKKLRKYILYLGIAYQIQDDILELEGSFENIGKLNTDERNNKKTFPYLLGLDESKKIMKDFIEKAKNEVLGCDKLIDFANYLLNREK